MKRQKSKPTTKQPTTDEAEQTARIRLLTAQTKKRSLRNAVKRGEVYEAAEVEREVAELCGMVRFRLQEIPESLQTEWPADFRGELTERMRVVIDAALVELSECRLSNE